MHFSIAERVGIALGFAGIFCAGVYGVSASHGALLGFSWLVVMLSCGGLLWILYIQFFGAPVEQDPYHVNTLARAMSIEFGASEKFSCLERFPEHGITRRSLRLAVKNIGDGALSDCRISVVGVAPPQKAGRLGILDGFTLQKGERKFVHVANYVENPGGNTANQTDIIIPVRQGGLWGALTSLERVEHDNAHVVWIEASASECQSVTVQFRVWVDSATNTLLGRLG